MSKEIYFYPSSKEVQNFVPPPKPARHYNPDWYKSVKFFKDNKPEFNNGQVKNLSVKSCAPFSDAMNFGYIQETWTDIYIEQIDGGIHYHFKNGAIPIMGHRASSSGVKFPEGFYEIEFAWIQPWSPILPKGYSVLYTNPMNNYDIQTYSANAVVDHDNFKYIPEGRYPFFLRQGFTGLIPAGTPMFQIIPFKTEDWKSSIFDFNEDLTNKAFNSLREKFWGKYRKDYRKDKRFL